MYSYYDSAAVRIFIHFFKKSIDMDYSNEN